MPNHAVSTHTSTPATQRKSGKQTVTAPSPQHPLAQRFLALQTTYGNKALQRMIAGNGPIQRATGSEVAQRTEEEDLANVVAENRMEIEMLLGEAETLSNNSLISKSAVELRKYWDFFSGNHQNHELVINKLQSVSVLEQRKKSIKNKIHAYYTEMAKQHEAVVLAYRAVEDKHRNNNRFKQDPLQEKYQWLVQGIERNGPLHAELNLAGIRDLVSNLIQDLNTKYPATNAVANVPVPKPKFDDPATWVMNDIEYANGVTEGQITSAHDGAMTLEKLGKGELTGNTRTKGTVICTGKVMHQHLQSMSWGIGFCYIVEKDNRVTPYVVDFADSRQQNKYNWKKGGTNFDPSVSLPAQK